MHCNIVCRVWSDFSKIFSRSMKSRGSSDFRRSARRAERKLCDDLGAALCRTMFGQWSDCWRSDVKIAT